MKNNSTKNCEGFSKLNRKKRIAKLIELEYLTPEDADFLTSNKLSFHLAENLIENVIGFYQLPLGVATNFVIDEKEYVIPMVVEETSVIAAASKTAKWIKENGQITTENLGSLSIGQIQISRVKNFSLFHQKIEEYKTELIDQANNDIANNMVKRGGGVKDIVIRKISRLDNHIMAVLHILVDTCDAMGANLINRICEYLKSPIEKLTGESINLCILSNLNDTKITRATITLNNIDKNLAKLIAEASLFANLDQYRAATNNKGVLNGMDAVAIATGNDWRALEAGVHAYAARTGKYNSITDWQVQDNKLIGRLEAPINIGTKGGVTKIHPTAALCLKILNVDKAYQLSRVIAAVGLVQNLGALRALTTEGIINGHMRLHIANLCLFAGAADEEIELVKKYLSENEDVKSPTSIDEIKMILARVRK